MERVAVSPSRARWIILMVGSLCFVAGGVFILFLDESPYVVMNIGRDFLMACYMDPSNLAL
jgi:hypothetical protein